MTDSADRPSSARTTPPGTVASTSGRPRATIPDPTAGPDPSASRPHPTPEVAAALAEVAAARADVAARLDDLSDAARSAVDIPAKVRRNPGKTLALAGGAGFLITGGPRRVLRAVSRRVNPSPRDPYDGLLPDEIERVLRDSAVAKDPEVRRALEADFAEYLRRKGRGEPPPSATMTFWRTFDRVAGPLGAASARVLVMRLMEAERSRATARARAHERDRGLGAPRP